MVELRHDVTSEQEPVVEIPPYRMVPGNDRVLSRDVLRRFNESMKMTPSRNQLRRKDIVWKREGISLRKVTELLTKNDKYERVNVASGNTGVHTMFVERINEVHVRWCGDPAHERRNLDRLADILRRDGYTVQLSEENNVDWPSGQSRTFVLARRNRQFLRVARFYQQRRKR